MRLLATPVSHLFQESNEFATRISGISDCLECRDRTYNYDCDKQIIFHSDYQPIHEFTEERWNYFEKVRELKKDIELVTFHVATVCDKPKVIKRIGYIGGRVYSRQEMLDISQKNFKRLREIFGPNVKLGIENNNYYPTPAYEHVCDPSFITELCEINDLYFLYDISHSVVSAGNLKISLEEYCSGLPMDRMIQVHICSPSVDENGLFYDAHLAPDTEELKVLKSLLKYPNLKYFTVEFYKDVEILLESLKKVKEIIA